MMMMMMMMVVVVVVAVVTIVLMILMMMDSSITLEEIMMMTLDFVPKHTGGLLCTRLKQIAETLNFQSLSSLSQTRNFRLIQTESVGRRQL